MDPTAFPLDPALRKRLEEELAMAALALLEFSGSDGVCVRLPAEGPGEEPAWVVAGSAASIRALAPDAAESRDSLDPR